METGFILSGYSVAAQTGRSAAGVRRGAAAGRGTVCRCRRKVCFMAGKDQFHCRSGTQGHRGCHGDCADCLFNPENLGTCQRFSADGFGISLCWNFISASGKISLHKMNKAESLWNLHSVFLFLFQKIKLNTVIKDKKT